MLTGPGVSTELARSLAPLLDAVRRRAVGAANTDDAVLHRAGLRSLSGGRNNTIFHAELDGRPICIKLHKQDDRRRDQREWLALNLLARHGQTAGSLHTPIPIGYVAAPPSALAMSALAGQLLGENALDAAQIDALATATLHVHAVTPPSIAAAQIDGAIPPARLTDEGMAREVAEFFLHTAAGQTALRRHLQLRWDRWAQGPDLVLLSEPAPVVFGQGDPNLTNCLWRDTGELALIDFEYAGWSNQPYELALLIEHVQSRRTPDSGWRRLFDAANLSGTAERRTLSARRLVAWFWVKTFWRPETDTDEPRFAAQAQRLLQVLSEPAS